MLRHFGQRKIDLTLEASGLLFLSELFNLLATPSTNLINKIYSYW